LRFGITTSLDFIGANLIRDYGLSTIFYGKPIQRAVLSAKGIGDDLFGTRTAQLYSRFSGLSGGQETASLSKLHLASDLASLKHKGWKAQRLTSMRGFFKIAEVGETATRMGLFRSFIDEGMKRGLDQYEALMEASWRARDYIDFDRSGSSTRQIARLVPFWNASMQGLDKFGRHMLVPLVKKVNGQRLTPEDERGLALAVKSWARVGVAMAGAASLTALNLKQEEFDEISTYTRSTHMMFKLGDKWLAAPKPFEVGALMNFAEAMVESFAENDPIAFERWREGLQ